MTMLIALAALQTAAANTAAPVPVPVPASPLSVLADMKRAAPVAGTPPPPAAAATHPDRARVLAAVKAEWPRYDTRRSGRLGPLEFSTWVMRANGASVAPAGVKGAAGIKPVSAMNATARAFARADANHDGGVTPDEMTDFLIR